MAILLKKYVPEAGTLTENGTIMSIVGKGGTAKFVPKNFNDATKRVVVVIKNKKGESAVLSCSAQVSSHLRNLKKDGKSASELLSWVAGLPVLENEEGTSFISMPSNGGAAEINLDTIKVVETAEFLPEELVAF